MRCSLTTDEFSLLAFRLISLFNFLLSHGRELLFLNVFVGMFCSILEFTDFLKGLERLCVSCIKFLNYS